VHNSYCTDENIQVDKGPVPSLFGTLHALHAFLARLQSCGVLYVVVFCSAFTPSNGTVRRF
jgi:hypothetical protein